MSVADLGQLAWEKMGGLLPAIVQDAHSGRVLMLAYMDKAALEASLANGRATFFSRSRQRLWEKGETSGNYLLVDSIFEDCDGDSLLVVARPNGPTCHTGSTSCFGNEALPGPGWLGDLSAIVRERAASGDEASYSLRLLREGSARIAQKVGEEGVEVALAAVSRPSTECAEELADLLYHVSLLMESLKIGWDEVMSILQARHARARSATASS